MAAAPAAACSRRARDACPPPATPPQVHLYGFGNGSCGAQCYHYYDCGPSSGSQAANQSLFLNSVKASGGFHNFSAQA